MLDQYTENQLIKIFVEVDDFRLTLDDFVHQHRLEFPTFRGRMAVALPLAATGK